MSEALPEGWAESGLGDLARRVTKGATPTSYGFTFQSQGIAFIKVENIRGGSVDHASLKDRISEEAHAAQARSRLRDGDVLFSIAGTIGTTCVIRPADLPANTNQALAIIRGTSDVLDVRYLQQILGHTVARTAVEETARGGGMNNISLADVSAFRIRVPPLAEQRRIVAMVEGLLAHVSAARKRLGRVRLILKRLRQAVFAAGCSGKLTEEWRRTASFERLEATLKRVRFEQSRSGRAATDVSVSGRCILSVGDPATPCPASWRWIPLANVARLESGHTPSRKHPEYWNGRVPWVGLQDARECHGRRILETRQHVTNDGLANSAARLLPGGTVCLSRTASVGYVVILGRPMATSQDFVNWVCSEALEPEFLMFALLAEGESIKNFGRGTTHTTIYFPEVKALHVCLPSVAEQREIVRRVRAILLISDSIERSVAAALSRAAALTRSIVAKAFRGELVPTEAELARAEGRGYESGEDLLIRIQSERAASVPTPNGRRRPTRGAGARLAAK